MIIPIDKLLAMATTPDLVSSLVAVTDSSDVSLKIFALFSADAVVRMLFFIL